MSLWEQRRRAESASLRILEKQNGRTMNAPIPKKTGRHRDSSHPEIRIHALVAFSFLALAPSKSKADDGDHHDWD
jgi:hypothetical protein